MLPINRVVVGRGGNRPLYFSLSENYLLSILSEYWQEGNFLSPSNSENLARLSRAKLYLSAF